MPKIIESCEVGIVKKSSWFVINDRCLELTNPYGLSHIRGTGEGEDRYEGILRKLYGRK